MSVVYLGAQPIAGFVGAESGLGVALRKDGEEILFASRGNDSKKTGIPVPLRWVKIEDFAADPVGLPSAEELMEMPVSGEEDDDDGGEEVRD